MMELPIQAAYLNIDWLERERVRIVTEAPEPIEIEVLPNGTWRAETQVFQGLCPWVGLRLKGELSDVQPAFEDLHGNLKPMLRIEDGRDGHWWVQDDGWDQEGKRHLSEMHRSMGQFTVAIGTYRLQLINIVDGLTRTDVESYLRDFQDDLIWLVMGFGGATAKTSGNAMENQEMVRALNSFATAARRVLADPAQNVHEIQAEERRSRLRPNGATFRQFLRHPTAQRLTGRAAEETPNIADNRYLRHMVQVCQKLASHAGRAASRYAQSFEDRARAENERSTSYDEMKHRQVDPQVFDRQMEELRLKLERVSRFSSKGEGSGKSVFNWCFRPGKPYGNSEDQIFYLQKDGRPASYNTRGVDWSVLQVPKELVRAMQITQSFCDYYSLDGTAHAEIKRTSQGKPYRLVTFSSIDKVQPFTGALERKTKKRDLLEQNDWSEPLNAKERDEMRQEAATARSRARVYEAHAEKVQQVSAVLSQCQAELHSQDLCWERMKVSPSPLIPMGVRFSHSPAYAACQAAFSNIIELSKGRGLPIECLDAIEQMGVLHASALYERWCLMKIISILVEDYRFAPEGDWQEPLIRAVTGKPQSFTLKFHRGDLGWAAFLEVQPELRNGRRPDFRLRFSRIAPVVLVDQHENQQWNNPHRSSTRSEAAQNGLIMDAKFRTQWRYGELGRTLNSLVDEKGYGQEGDRVFILHPAPRAILKPSSPLEWGRHCDYGQDREQDHRKGVIYLAPAAGDANLRRLIVMQLQASFPPPTARDGDSRIHCEGSFCVRCGHPYQSGDVQQKYTKRKNPFWTFKCGECGMHVTRTHCFACKGGRLFKNGLQLTYHRTVADQVTNIVCPHCGEFFDSDLHGSRSEQINVDTESHRQ